MTMLMNRNKWQLAIAAVVCGLSLFKSAAAEGSPAPDPQSSAQSPMADSEEPEFVYPTEHHPTGVLTDAEEDLSDMFPHRDSVLPGFRMPRSWGYEQFKEGLYEKWGLKIGASYQMLYQYASETTPSAEFDSALGHWWGFTTKWTPFRRGKDFEGSVVFSAHERVGVGDHAVPAQFGGADIGSSWSNYEFTEWTFSVKDLYWEQRFKKDRLVVRAGNQIPTAIMNSFRFKDARTSFTSSPFAFHESIPNGAPQAHPGAPRARVARYLIAPTYGILFPDRYEMCEQIV